MSGRVTGPPQDFWAYAYVGIAVGALLVFLLACSVATHRGATWVTEDVVAPVLFTIFIWPVALPVATVYFAGRAVHAGIGVLVKPRRTTVSAGDPVQRAAEDEVEKLLQDGGA